MAVYILTDNSILLNHLDSQVLFPFDKSARMQGFNPVSWRLFAVIPGKWIQKGNSRFRVIGNTTLIELLREIKPVHAPTPHSTGFPPASVRVGVVVSLKKHTQERFYAPR